MKWRYIWVLCGLLCTQMLFAKEFVVVIDAGHGGKDPGAVSGSVEEKTLNLKVALMVGEQIEKLCEGVKVVYTRSNDKFVAVKDRPLIAKRAHADLFISIHTNASESRGSSGTETYILGLGRADDNFEVVKRENSVILLENDGESYQGFDPTSPDSYIMFEMMQDKHMEQSLLMADLIQQQFDKKTNRVNRGVRQGQFWVLHQTGTPSVLIEMGFVSNASDREYMTSTKGRNAIVNSIVEAFVQYKRAYDQKNGVQHIAKGEQKPQEKQPAAEKESGMEDKVEFKVQLFVSKEVLPAGHVSMKGERRLEYYKEGSMYKYTSKGVSDFKEVKRMQKELSAKFPDCFVIAFVNGKRVPTKEALEKIKK